MRKEEKQIVDRTRLSNILAVAYVLNRSFCAFPEHYMKLEEVMKEVAEHLSSDLNQPNDIVERMDKERRQFRRYIKAVSASIFLVETKEGKNGGYRLKSNIADIPMFSDEECTLLSLTLSRSDLVASLKEKPTIGKRLNQELVKAGYSVSGDVLYGLMDAIDAIQKNKKIELINYQGGQKLYPSLTIAPVAIRWFKGAYYVVCVSKKSDGTAFFWDCRLERAESRNPLDDDNVVSYKESDLKAYIDDEAFGLHRGTLSERKKYIIKATKDVAYRVEESLDHKVHLLKTDDDYCYYEVISYQKSELASYLYYLIRTKKVSIID